MQPDPNRENLTGVSHSPEVDGLTLVRLTDGLKLPQPKNGNYCQWRNTAGSWLLWHPTYLPFAPTIDRRGNDVRLLQQQLADAGFYTEPVDGIVGAHTLDGLNTFRRQHGLSDNDTVDGLTIFLLTQNSDEISQGKQHG